MNGADVTTNGKTVPRSAAPRMGRVITLAGLLTCGSSRDAGLPGRFAQWHMPVALAAHSCGGSHGFAPRSLFSGQGPEPRLERLNAGRLTAQELRSCHLPARGFGAAWEWMAPAVGMHGTDLGNAAPARGRRRIEAGFPGDSPAFYGPNLALEWDAEIE